MKINNKGFTLVEILISVAIVITSATIVVAIITASFRGSTQTNINEDLRLEGNSALSQVGKMIQFADGFVGVVDGTNTEYSNCVTNDEDASYTEVKLLIDGEVTTISCKDDTVRINDNPLFESSKAVVENCAVRCSQTDTTDSPTIGVEFDLSRNDSSLIEQRSSMRFEKNIKMRNLNQ